MDKFLIGCLLIVLVVFGISLFFAWLFMILWNNVVPTFWSTCPIISIWEALGVLIIIDIIGFFFSTRKS